MKNFYVSKIKNNNSGFSFLFVIFGVIFIAAIGVIALTMASNYYITTKVDESSTEQFYTTEAILQEVRTGLGEYANDCAKEAYEETISKFSDTGTQTREEKYSSRFLSLMADKLTGTGDTWDGTENAKSYVCDIQKIKELTTKPDSVDLAPGAGSIGVVLYNKSSAEAKFHMVIKNLYVNYTDEKGYNSKIKTDVILNVPDYHLEGDSTFNELKNYIVITDNILDIKNSGGHQVDTESKMTGNIYAGNKDDSIIVNDDMGGTKVVLNSDRIITRGDFNIRNGSDVQISNRDGTSTADLWLMNMVLAKSNVPTSNYSVVSANVNAYVEDDLVIDASNSTLNLKGSYYGYSFNKNNDSSTTDLKSFYSSAMLINGRNTTLNTNGLYKLILAGRAFIEKRGNDIQNSNITSDIQMGESLSVKSNQLAYLVPDEYISTKENPAIEGALASVDTDALLASNIRTFLDSSNPVTTNHLQGEQITYFFLKFKDENNANQYFKKFYSDEDNKTELERSARTYITSVIGDDGVASGLKLDSSLYLLAGNIINNYKMDGTSEMKEANYFNNLGQPKVDILSDGIIKGKEYVGRQLTLLPHSASTMRMDDPEEKPIVTSRIIDFGQISGDKKIVYPELNASIFITDGNTSVTSSIDRGIIVAAGNVTVNKNFEGLIIAKGTVTVEGKVTASNNIVLTREILKQVVKDESINRVFREYKTFDSNTVKKVSVSDYITYKNWSKNDAN